MIHVIVPATSANMGPGFDSIGVAVELYNELWVEEIPQGLEIIVKKKQAIEIPTDESNFIYQVMKDFYKVIGIEMPGVRLIQEDNIPMVRGLGSSAACIVAGLLAANVLAGNPYTREQLAQLGAKMEGHPDNTNPAFFGSLVVGALNEEKMCHVVLPLPEDMVFAVMVPDFPVSTSASRNVLPDSYSRADVVFNVSRAALLIASLYSGKLENMEMAMEDCVHQPYRKQLVMGMDEIFTKAKEYGAMASYLSGAGSTLASVLTVGVAKTFESKMKTFLETLPNHWELKILKPDIIGAKVTVE